MTVTGRTIARVERLIWVLAFGGFFAIALGIDARRTSPATGWSLIIIGVLAASAGAVLVWVRSRLREQER